MLTGSLPESCYGPSSMHEALQEKEGDVKQYFENLGYRVSWDMNSRMGEKWWEILDNKSGRLIVQIDMGVPLKYVIEDICSFYKGTPCIDRPDKPDWKFSGEDGPNMDALLKRVYQHNNLQSE